MEKRARSAIASGVILVVVGVLLLVSRLVPGIFGSLSWPFLVIGVGVLLFVLAIATGNAGLAVPACIVGGIGLILWWQNLNNRWDTWAYAWALIPGFVGVGALVQGLLEAETPEGDPRRAVAHPRERHPVHGVQLVLRRPALRRALVLRRRRRAHRGRRAGHAAAAGPAPGQAGREEGGLGHAARQPGRGHRPGRGGGAHAARRAHLAARDRDPLRRRPHRGRRVDHHGRLPGKDRPPPRAGGHPAGRGHRSLGEDPPRGRAPRPRRGRRPDATCSRASSAGASMRARPATAGSCARICG